MNILIVKPSVGSWTARKVNRTATGQYNANVGAVDANQVLTQLLPKSFLDPWQSLAHKLRAETRRYCAFVYDDGWFAFSNAGYEHYRDKAWLTYVPQFDKMKIDMVSKYEVMRQFQINRAGNTPQMQDMYPTPQWFEQRFYVNLRINTIALPSELFALTAQERAQVQYEHDKQLGEARSALYLVLEKQLVDLQERLIDPEALKNMRYAVLDNLKSYLEDLPLKVLDNADPILSLRDAVLKRLLEVNGADVKDDPEPYSEVVKKSLEDLKNIRVMFGY